MSFTRARRAAAITAAAALILPGILSPVIAYGLSPVSVSSASPAPGDETLLELDRFGNITLGMSLQDVVRESTDPSVVSEGDDELVIQTTDALITLRNDQVVEIAPTGAVRVENAGPGDQHTVLEPWLGPSVDSGSDDVGDWLLYQPRRGSADALRVYVDGDGAIVDLAICSCATPTASIDDLAFWEISPNAVGPIEVGMTVDEVRKIVPDAVNAPAPGEQWILVGEDWAPQLTAVLDADNTVSGITIGTATLTYQTRIDGAELPSIDTIRVGDDGLRVKNAFPGGTAVRFDASGVTRYNVADRHGQVVAFTLTQRGWSGEEDVLADSRVIGISVGPAALN